MDFKNKNMLVAGGAGFVGANLIDRLLSLGVNVRATLYREPPIIEDKRVEYVWCDLTKMEDCKRVVSGVDYVFMCAANTSGAAVIRSTPLVHVTPNIVMNSQLLEATYFAKVKKVVCISSSVVYPSGDISMKEDKGLVGDPDEVYFGAGWMKRYTEILCRLYSEKLKPPMATVVLRPANIYGRYDKFDFETSHVLAALIRRVVDRHNPIEVWGTGDDVRDWIYIDDFIDAVILATEKVETYNPINVASGRGYSIKQALKIIMDVDGYTNAKIVFDPSKPSTIPIRLLDTAKAEAILGFRAKTGLDEGIRKTIEWYREIKKR